MKLIFKFFQINLILLSSINSLIILPLYHQPKKLNISSAYEFINNYMPNNLYSLIQIGNPPQKIEVIINEEDIIFSIRKYNCLLKNYYFNKTKSNTFIKEKNSTIFYQSEEAKDTFYFYNNYKDISPNNIIKVDNLGFILENEKRQGGYNDNLNYNCVILSLNLFRYNIANNNFNFILELKKLGIIQNHAWSIIYNTEINDNKDPNLEGYLIIGDYPHNYQKEKYDILSLRSSMNNMNEKGWNLNFRNITINNDTILTHYLTGIISFSNSYIIGTEEYKSKISNIFFRRYTEKNICYDDNSNSHYFLYYCKKNEFNEKDIKSFPELNFFHAEFNYTFKFNGKDLFFEKNGFYYFLIIFDRYDYKSWTLGKLFLKKYQLVFEHESKKINFYINKISKEEKNDTNYYINNYTLIIIILASFAGISFIIGLIIGKIKFGTKKRNHRANELDNEDNGDYFINKKNESITDSDDATNTSEEKIIN